MNLLKKGFYILLLLSITISCNEDEDFTLIEGLDFVIASLSDDGREVGVVPTTVSGGDVLYTVDFGETSDDDSDVLMTSGPLVEYKYPNETATYRITVTASLEGAPSDVSLTKEYTVTIQVAPPSLSGIEGTWKLAPEAGALGVGPAQDDVSWWASSSDDVTGRACLFDDEYVFNADGTFQNVLGSDTWLEAWQGAAEDGCAAPVFPHDGTATATYEYNATAGTITLEGTGAYLGLAKVINGGELSTPSEAAESITYIAAVSADGNTIELDIEIAGGGFWSFKLAKEGSVTPPPPPSGSAIEGAWKLAPAAGALGVGPSQGDVSWWSSSSDDVTVRACLFDDQYVFNSDGTFENVLGSDTWVEGWQGNDPEGCAAPVFPHDGTASATYEYNETAGTITLEGAGAFLGLAKVINGGELSTPSAAEEEITYIATLDGDTLKVEIEIAGGGFWTFNLVKDVPLEGVQGSWKLAPAAGALGVGPSQGDVSWWSSSSDDVTVRACLFDDQYVFNSDGTFENVLGSDTWVEGWQGNDPEGCAAPVFPHDGTASATYEYNETAGTITLEGAGAFLGLAKVINGGELSTPSAAEEEITYIATLDGDTLKVEIEIAGGGFWTFNFVR